MRPLFSWIGVSGVLLLATPAHAVSETFACTTVTERPVAEIVFPLPPSAPDMEHIAQSSIPALTILPGEILCLAGVLDDEGSLGELRVIPAGDEESTPVVRLELNQHGRTSLTLQHTFDAPLFYRAAIISADAAITWPTTEHEAEPDDAQFWDDEVRELLLYGLSQRRSVPGSDVADGKPPSVRFDDPSEDGEQASADGVTEVPPSFYGAFTGGIWGGWRRVRASTIDGALAAAGYAPLPADRVVGGVEVGLALSRVRFGVELGAWTAHSRRADGAQFDMWTYQFGFTGGYELLRLGGVRLFAGSGLIRGTISMSSRADGLDLFPSLEPWEGTTVEQSHWLIPFELGVETIIPVARISPWEYWGVQLGLRVAHLQQVRAGSWVPDHDGNQRSLGRHPSIDVSGQQVRLVLGFGVVMEPPPERRSSDGLGPR